MQAVGFGLAIVGFLLSAAVWFRSAKQQERAQVTQSELERQLSQSKQRTQRAEAEVEVKTGLVERLEADLAEAVARRDERAIAAALWQLELERSYRQWRDVIVPSVTTSPVGEINAGQQLAFAISQEVDRLREEVGISIRFDGALDLPLEPETALGGLRISEELLALASKRCDELSVSVDQGEEPSLSILIECQGWEAGETPEMSQLEGDLDAMAARLEGWLRWERRHDDYVTITLRLPAPIPQSVAYEPITDVEPITDGSEPFAVPNPVLS